MGDMFAFGPVMSSPRSRPGRRRLAGTMLACHPDHVPSWHPRQQRRLAWVLPALVAVVLFADSVRYGFVIDDEEIIEKNEVAHDASDLGRIFSTDYWVAVGSPGQLYRPLTILTYA